MKPFSAMTTPELLDEAESLARKLRERLADLPADFDHNAEMFAADAEELRDLAAYISEQAGDICLDRMRPSIDDGPLPAPVCAYFEGRSIDLPGDPEPINLFVERAS